MHPRLQARATPAALARAQHATVLKGLDLAIDHLSLLVEFIPLGPLVAKLEADRALVAERELPPQEMNEIASRFAAILDAVNETILKPFSVALRDIELNRASGPMNPS